MQPEALDRLLPPSRQYGHELAWHDGRAFQRLQGPDGGGPVRAVSVCLDREGLLWLAAEMKKAGELPAGLVLKISVLMGPANPLSVRWMEQLGAGTYNVPTDLTLPQLAAVRQARASPATPTRRSSTKPMTPASASIWR